MNCGHPCEGSQCVLDNEGFPRKIVVAKIKSDTPLLGVNLFLETSGSMKGFMPSNSNSITEFQKVIPDFISRISDESKLTFYSIFDSKSSFKRENVTKVNAELIPGGKFNWSGDTELPTLIDSLNKYISPNQVNIFISDCIYSPNNNELTAQTIGSIRSKFNKYSGQYTTSVYCLKSNFFYAGRLIAISPYYLIIQGKPNNVKSLEVQLLKTLATFDQKYDEVHFGKEYSTPYYSILPYTETSGNFIAAQSKSYEGAYVSLQDIDFSEMENKTKFWIALNLNDLPSYAKQITYLQDNLNINSLGAKITKLKIEDSFENVNHDDEHIKNKCNVFIQLKIDAMTENCALINISLKKKRPIWISKLNNNDPITMNIDRSHTYGLTNLIEGIAQAYDSTEKSYFFNDVQISLLRKQ